MEITNLILTGLVFPAVYFISKHFASSYFNEKGKNLATKEDIADITAEVKKVESMFSVSTSSQIDYNSLKRKAILDFFQSLNTWIALIISNNFRIESSRYKENDLFLGRIREAAIEYNIKKEGLFLFLEAQPFDSLSSNTAKSIMDMFYLLNSFCSQIEDIHIKSQSIRETEAKITESLLIYKESFILEHRKYSKCNAPLISFLNNQLKETFKKECA